MWLEQSESAYVCAVAGGGSGPGMTVGRVGCMGSGRRDKQAPDQEGSCGHCKDFRNDVGLYVPFINVKSHLFLVNATFIF